MKKLFALLLVLTGLTSSAQFATYNLSTVSLGTNAVPANATLALPLTIETRILTNQGVTALWYSATNTLTVTNRFTLPSATNLATTVTGISSNLIVGLQSKTWTDYVLVSNVNPNPYYVTNAAWTSNYVIFGTNASTVIPARKTTNYQAFVFNAPVTYSATGTDATYSTNYLTGATAIDVSRSSTAIVLLSFNLTGAGTSAVTLNYQPTIDGGTTNTAAGLSLALAANGTTTVSTNFPINIGAHGYLKLINLVNGNGTAVTNIAIKVAQKVQSP